VKYLKLCAVNIASVISSVSVICELSSLCEQSCCVLVAVNDLQKHSKSKYNFRPINLVRVVHATYQFPMVAYISLTSSESSVIHNVVYPSELDNIRLTRWL